MSDPAIASCPECGGAVKRLISGGAGVISKGGESGAATGGCAFADACGADEIGCGDGMCRYGEG